MSLSSDPTFSLLKSSFVCGWRDITGEPWSGRSGRYDSDDGAVWTTNGAGPHNIQMFVLAPDGTVLHCLPGYWESHDLAEELGFAQTVARVWSDPALSRTRKESRYRAMHLDHLGHHSREMVARSEMQGFDKKFEAKRAATSDCILDSDSIKPRFRPRKNDRFKTTDQIVHERMAARPFVPYAEFDVAAYTDYGRQKYDKKQAHIADLLPKAGTFGKFRDRLRDTVDRKLAASEPRDDEAAPGDRRAERRSTFRALLQEAIRKKMSRQKADDRSGR